MIQTARLVIRAPIAADFETFWRMNNDPDVKRYTGGVTALSREAVLAQHEESCRSFDAADSSECIFSVEERSTGRCIGFDTLCLDVVTAAVNPENAASERILIKLGMSKTGQLPWPGQGLVDRYEIRRSSP